MKYRIDPNTVHPSKRHMLKSEIPPVAKWPLITLYLITAAALIVAVIKWAE